MAIDLYELALRFKSEGFAAVSRDMDTLDKKGKGISKAFTALKATLIVGAVGGFIRKIAVESIEAQKQTAQLNAVLKSTGGVAGVTADEIDKMAGSLQKTTTFSDEAVKSAASLLLTFTSIRGEVFRQTLPAITDLATAMGSDLNSAAIQVGKALNDPIRGVSALQRVGVSFSAAQKEVIKNLVETNRLAEAQGVILKELSVQFGGSAKAARDTLGGALAGLSNAWGDLFEVTQDSSRGIVGAINDIADALPNARSKIDTAFSGLIQWIRETEVRMARLQAIAFSINRFFGGNAQGVGVGAKGGGGGGGRDNGPGMLPGVVVNAPGKVAPLGGGGGTKTGKSGSLIPSFDFGANIGSDVMNRIAGIGQDSSEVAALVGMSPDALQEVFKNAADAIKEGEKTAEDALREYENKVKGVASEISSTLGAAIQNGFVAAFSGEGIGGAIKAFGQTILQGLGSIFVQMGEKMIAASAIMEAFSKALIAFIPGGGLVAGALLVALGAAMGGFGGAGKSAHVAASAGYENTYGRGSAEATRLKFVDRPGSAHNLVPAVPIHFTLVGANDARVQREIETIVVKASRRHA